MKKSYYYLDDGSQQVGPVSLEKLMEMKQTGIISDETLVWTDGLTQWIPFHTQHPDLEGASSETIPVDDATTRFERTVDFWGKISAKMKACLSTKPALFGGGILLLLLGLSLFSLLLKSPRSAVDGLQKHERMQLPSQKKQRIASKPATEIELKQERVQPPHKSKQQEVSDAATEFGLKLEPWTPALSASMKIIVEREGNYEKALLAALDQKEFTIAYRLIQDGARVSKQDVGGKAIKKVIDAKNPEFLNYLIKQGAKVDFSQISSFDSLEICKALEKNGVPVLLIDAQEKEHCCLSIALRDNYAPEVVEYVFDKTDISKLNDEQYKSSCCAALSYQKNHSYSSRILESGIMYHRAVIDEIFSYAFEKDDCKAVEKLLSLQCKPTRDIVAKIKSVEMAKLFVAAGYDVISPINDEYPLSRAIMDGNESLAIYLISNGADMYFQAPYIVSPMHCVFMRCGGSISPSKLREIDTARKVLVAKEKIKKGKKHEITDSERLAMAEIADNGKEILKWLKKWNTSTYSPAGSYIEGRALTMLGMLYYEGNSVKKDEAKAVSLFDQASRNEYSPIALELYGMCLATGIGGGPKTAYNWQKGNEIVRKAQEQGLKKAKEFYDAE